MLILNDNILLAKGSERDCYIHPNDTSKLIKIIARQKESNNQNNLEYLYYEYLNSKSTPLDHIARCYGWIDTNLGRGLIFERILNYDGSDSINFRTCIKNHILNREDEETILKELKNYLHKYNILFADATTLNVMCQEIEPKKYKLIIIDGLGAKRYGFKFNLYLKIHFYKHYKMTKQWKLFLNNIQKIKLSIKN